MIDPNNIVKKYNRPGLEELLVFSVCVAGKTASIIAPAVHEFIKRGRDRMNQKTCMVAGHWKDNKRPSAFKVIRYYGRIHDAIHGKLPWDKELAAALKEVGIGCYKQKATALIDLVNADLDLKTCTVEELESVWGIGPKTARFFLMASRPGVEYAALDTHLLKWLRDQGVDAPKTTPTGKRYLRLEQEFLNRVPKNMTPAEFDLEIWRQYANADAR